jgi:ABC-type Fe3+-hydroxamate transport system substrate-binding protein
MKQFLLISSVCLLLSACGKKEAASNDKAQAAPKQPAVSLENLVGKPAEAPAPPAAAVAEAPPDAPATAPAAPSPSLDSSDPIASFNRALQKWASEHDVVPRDLEALKSMTQVYSDMPELPKPPAGRRLVYSYDKKTLEPRTVMIRVE